MPNDDTPNTTSPDGQKKTNQDAKMPGQNIAANPYFDQQVQPGQVVGYNIPTNQKVEIPIVKSPKIHSPSKKFLRSLIVFAAVMSTLVILAGIVYLGVRITSS